MYNPLEGIYSGIVDTLNERIGTLALIDLDLGQMDKDSPEEHLKFPAVLLKFGDIIWKDLNEVIQEGVVNVNVKVIYKFKNETDIYSPLAVRGEAITFLELLADIHDAIKDVRSEFFSRLIRYNEFQITSKWQFLHWEHVMQYQCNILTEGKVSNPEVLNISYDAIRDENDFMNRKRFNLLSK